METEEERLKRDMELQGWQEEILAKSSIIPPLVDSKPLDLKPQQKDMIERLLFPSDSNPYWVEEEYKRILLRVLTWGYYREEDREALNYARECYLRGRNWIK